MGNAVNDALSNNGFTLYGQPIIPIQTGSGESSFCELLLRMTAADGDLIYPAHFIPTAERYNVMPAIDRWVVNAGFAGLAQCLLDRQGTGNGNPLLSINLSGQSLRSPGFIRHVRDCLDKYRLNPSCVCFEITETVAVDDIAQASRFIEELKKWGFRFALDDFGTGFSSFEYLSELLVDFIKIDGSFVRKLSDGKVNPAIVRSIVDIGKAAGIRTIAEHVENQSQMNKLAELEVDYAQGYLIDHPAVFDEQTKYLSAVWGQR